MQSQEVAKGRIPKPTNVLAQCVYFARNSQNFVFFYITNIQFVIN